MIEQGRPDLWWKEAVVYCVDTKTFLDSNGDGWGDLIGLTNRLGYLRDLGVNTLWLLPHYPSPLRDDGYDISDYYGVDPRLGTLGDFVELIRAAHAMGLRVITEMVLNHSSDEHPWFVSARSRRDSPHRDFYIWADEPQPDDRGVVFPGEQTEVWTHDEATGQYYFHRYHDYVPDLNISNPDVRIEMHKIMGAWLQLDVDGFRMDSLPFLVEKSGVEEPDPRHLLRDLRSFATRRRGDFLLLGEANVEPEEQVAYFGDETMAQTLFDFTLQANTWVALAKGDAGPIRRALSNRPEIPQSCQFAFFLRHHDELTLEIGVTKQERDEVFETFAPDESSRIYGRGIRRRLAPLLGGDQRRIRLALSLLMALPGTPILLYGDEIGLGDNLDLPGRLSVRVPMQWSDGPNGGFSTAAEDRLIRPVSANGQFGYKRVNVESQRYDPESMLSFTRNVIRTRRNCPEIGWGPCEILETGQPQMLTMRVPGADGDLVTMHNLGDEPVQAESPRGMQLLADQQYPDQTSVVIGPYGFRWVRT